VRIIAGEFRGRRLLDPERLSGDSVTRPITDRVKQSLFDILTPVLTDAIVYDCFAGTGSMGLESISRGAAKATFFEKDRSALARLQKNIATLGIQDRCRVIAVDLFKWFAASEAAQDRIDVIFLDPPYRFLREKSQELKTLSENISQRHLKPDGVIIFRHERGDELELPAFRCVDRREYGSMVLELLSPAISA
jgi:16S rRNA (guanine(966)-N(2))-methyltransferase RsmD